MEPKNIFSIKDIVQNVTKAGNLVVDACEEIFSVGKASVLLHNYIRLIRREVDLRYVTEAIQQLISLYV